MTTRGQAGARQGRGGGASAVVGQVMRWLLRLVGLVVVVLLVVGIGIGVRQPAPEPPVYSATEQAQIDAEDRYRSLADAARSAVSQENADGTVPDVLTALAADLDAQADAVGLPRSPGAEPTGTAAPGVPAPALPADASRPATPTGPATGPATAPLVEPAQVLSGLRDSALDSLRAAVNAEPGPGRVLAAAGANQWRRTLLLGQALGVDSPLPSADAVRPAELEDGAGLFSGLPSPAPDTTDDDAGSSRGASPDCAGTPLGPESDRQALRKARTAEEQARYGYEVGAALGGDPARALALSAVHAAAADAASDRLAALCVPLAPAPAGYAVGAAFRADPVAALRELEQDHVELYAGLVATVGPDVRPWAILAYNGAVQRSVSAGTPLEPLPGLVPGPADEGASAAPGTPPAPSGPPAPAPTPEPGREGG